MRIGNGVGAWCRIAGLIVLTLAPWISTSAQDPVRLPTVMIKEKPAPPGPSLLVGVVKDTSSFAVGGVEVTIPSLKRITYSKDDGTFRFENVPRGDHSVRARKIGYAAQIRVFKVEAQGGVGEFELFPLQRALPAVVTTAVRKGLSGTIGDTAFRAIEGADVSVLGKNLLRAQTDSVGGFWLPVPPGSYMVSIKRAGYADKLTAVTVPEDSGRRMTAFLSPHRTVPVREVWNIPNLELRQAWRNQLKEPFYSREDIQKYDIVWIYDLVSMAARTKVDPDCAVVVDGGPAIAKLSTFTVDDVEAVEVFGGGGLLRPVSMSGDPRRRNVVVPKGKAPNADAARAAPDSNAIPANFANKGMACVTTYVWLR